MATAAKRLSYSEVLSYALLLPDTEQRRLSEELLEKSKNRNIDYWLNVFEPNQDISEEEILAEFDAVRENVYGKKN